MTQKSKESHFPAASVLFSESDSEIISCFHVCDHQTSCCTTGEEGGRPQQHHSKLVTSLVGGRSHSPGLEAAEK